tara:strand:- start:917 stop:1693 length:777 start_codon:yes stop_codon:yes gene_type:complete
MGMGEIPYLMNNGGEEYNIQIKNLELVELPVNQEATGGGLSKTMNQYMEYREISDSSDKLDFGTDIKIINTMNADEEMNRSLLSNNIQLLKSVSNRYKNLENNDKYNETMKELLEEDIDMISDDIKSVEDSINDKNRLVQIQTYYSNKKQHQRQMAFTLIKICLFMLIVCFIYKMNLMGDNVFIAFVTIGLVSFVVYTVMTMYDIMVRDDVIYDEYAYTPPPRYPGKHKDMKISDVPLYEQEDIISNKCYNIMKNNSS